jgi:uncharacterized repeat protein (TIGR01451 family)
MTRNSCSTRNRPWKTLGIAGAVAAFALVFLAAPAMAGPTAQIIVTKTSDPAPGNIITGTAITFTITIQNNGPNGAPQGTVVDTIPTGITVDSVNATVPDTCMVVGQVVTCSVQGVGNGNNDSLTINAHISAGSGTIDPNCADWSTDDAQFTLGSGSMTHGCTASGWTVVQQADISIAKTQTSPDPANNPVFGGTNVTYHVVATNNGPSDAETFDIADDISGTTGGTFVSVTNVSSGLDCSSATAFPFTCSTTSTLAKDGTVSFDVTVTADNTSGTLTNTATAENQTTTDTNSANDSDSVDTTVCKSTNLAITKAAQDLSHTPITEVTGGSDFLYHIVVTNNGPDATGVTVSDTLPAGVSYVSDTDSCDTGSLPTISCDLTSILNGNSKSFDVRVTAVQSGPFDNTADVTSNECDRDGSDNSATASITIKTNNMPTALEVDKDMGADTGTLPDNGLPPAVTLNRVFEPNEIVLMDPTWKNTLENDVAVTGTVANFTGPGDGGVATYTIVDNTADYGTIPGNDGTSDCFTATANCYELKLEATSRPVQHWDAQVDETLSTGEMKTWALHIGGSFTDIPTDNLFYRFVETIYHNHITVGGGNSCPTTEYCYGDPTQRDQMTAFIARGMAGMDSLIPTSGTGYDCAGATTNFTDTPPGSTFCKHANYLYVNNITTGCGGGLLCAQDNTTRGEVAIFIARALQWQAGHTADPDSFVPTSGTDGMTRTYDCTQVGMGPFPDVPYDSVFCKYVGYLWVNHIVDGFTSGPNTGNYGPALDIRRDEISKILSNAFVNLPLYGP